MAGLNNIYTYYQWFANLFFNTSAIYNALDSNSSGLTFNSSYQLSTDSLSQYTYANTTISNSTVTHLFPYQSFMLPNTKEASTSQLNMLNALLNDHFIINNPSINATNTANSEVASEVFAKNGLNTPGLMLQINPFFLNAAYNMNLGVQNFLNIAKNIINTPQGTYPQFGSYESLWGANNSQSITSKSIISLKTVLANWNWLYWLCMTGVISSNSLITPYQQFQDIINATNGLVPQDNQKLQQIISSGNQGSANTNTVYFCPLNLQDTILSMPIYLPIQYNNLAEQYAYLYAQQPSNSYLNTSNPYDTSNSSSCLNAVPQFNCDIILHTN